MAKKRREHTVSSEIIKILIKEYDIKSISDIQNALKDLFAETL